MKIFIYKLLISIVAIYALFEITIGARLDHFTDITNSIKNVDQRTLVKEKIKNEMKKAIEKENYFTEEERYLISNFIKKIQSELSLDKDN